ncbi:hypothetical protein N7447_000485 [Penicillium robsamsonii]|uniref:uncharacterized protein n=1 Tax=Penicillium robsamsonii TaxID=1792511 RepID=UPI002548C405|nr:uncharacterized protein N7447_000485 [Penicillium robsamsonii]KAJ5834459.1 hypothetical protein N7447_000485 [Penicillium robsamsonii]
MLFATYGELTQTPFIRKGLVGHLILFYNCYLHFEGPTTAELSRPELEALYKGKTRLKYFPTKSHKPNEKEIKVVDFPSLVANRMHKFNIENSKIEPGNGPINLYTLEIWE